MQSGGFTAAGEFNERFKERVVPAVVDPELSVSESVWPNADVLPASTSSKHRKRLEDEVFTWSTCIISYSPSERVRPLLEVLEPLHNTGNS